MCIADVTIEALLALRPSFYSESRVKAFDILDGSISGLAAVTTVVATSIIGWNIWSSINRHGAPAEGRHRNIFDILIQTSAIYCICLVGSAISDFLVSSPFNPQPSEIMLAVTNYFFSVSTIIAVQHSSPLMKLLKLI